MRSQYSNIALFCRLTNSERDTLLMTFKDAKLSLVEYCPETHDLVTLSLHHWEEDTMKDGYVHNEWVPSVRIAEKVAQ